MEIFIPRFSRRQLMQFALGGSAALHTSGAFAEYLAKPPVLTPAQTEGPFYPDKLPLDTDNDLIVLNDALTSAVGEVTYLSGRVLDARGEPVRGALVEIWQCDAFGNYRHTRGANPQGGHAPDSNFQSFGRFLTGSKGEYLFRTIKPVPYPGRAPHIHMAIKCKGEPKFVTQCYIKGYAQNDTDGVIKSIKDKRQRESVMVAFEPLKESAAGELGAKFDVILGYTPAAH
jgi:protocatechuate 3,4-dioxygenase beta subunit